MKTLQSICLFIALLVPATFMAQPIALATSAPILLNQEWEHTDNWLQTFRNTFGKDAATNWMSELAMEGEFYTNTVTGGFIVVLPKYIDTVAKMHAKSQYGIYENKGTRLLPISGETALACNLCTARFLGYLGGVPATLDMAVIKEGGKYLTLMGFYPGQELSNDFFKKFQQVVERNYGERAFAAQ